MFVRTLRLLVFLALFFLSFYFVPPVLFAYVPISIRIPIFKCAISQTSFLSLDATFGFCKLNRVFTVISDEADKIVF